MTRLLALGGTPATTSLDGDETRICLEIALELVHGVLMNRPDRWMSD